MAHRDSLYRLLYDLIQFGDTYVGGKRPEKKAVVQKGGSLYW